MYTKKIMFMYVVTSETHYRAKICFIKGEKLSANDNTQALRNFTEKTLIYVSRKYIDFTLLQWSLSEDWE